MDAAKFTPATVDEYILQFPPDVQIILQEIRVIIKAAAPQAVESVSYGMAAYHLNGVLIFFAGYKKHIGLYPRTAGMDSLEGVDVFPGTKASIHFPLNKPMPYDLIRKIVEVRVKETTQ